MTRKCTKCGYISNGLFKKKHRCIRCGSQTQKAICRKLKDLRGASSVPLKD